jgi:hypothetical protein
MSYQPSHRELISDDEIFPTQSNYSSTDRRQTYQQVSSTDWDDYPTAWSTSTESTKPKRNFAFPSLEAQRSPHHISPYRPNMKDSSYIRPTIKNPIQFQQYDDNRVDHQTSSRNLGNTRTQSVRFQQFPSQQLRQTQSNIQEYISTPMKNTRSIPFESNFDTYEVDDSYGQNEDLTFIANKGSLAISHPSSRDFEFDEEQDEEYAFVTTDDEARTKPGIDGEPLSHSELDPSLVAAKETTIPRGLSI